MRQEFFEAVGGEHGELVLGSMEEGKVRDLESDFPTFHHPGQLPPRFTKDGGEWRTWLLMAGRGFGKTRAGAEWVWSLVREKPKPACPFVSSEDETPISGAQPHGLSSSLEANGIGGSSSIHIALVAATVEEARFVMVEGPSGLLALAGEKEIAEWSPSLNRLRFASGALATLYSGARGESLRGPEHSHAWCDELAKWGQAENAWNNLQLGLRVGPNPRALITTTPRMSALLQRIREAPDTVETGGATQANCFLPRAFVSAMQAQYGETRLGLQELEGRLLDDVVGSLWPVDLVERCRVNPPRNGEVAADAPASDDGGGWQSSAAHDGGPPPPSAFGGRSPSPFRGGFTRTVIGVDPPASAGGTCGIVVCALGADGCGYVLADCSVGGASPEQWARAVADAAARFDADRVVAEKNQGGAMVRSVLLAASATLPVELVHASVGKAARAEPVAALFENKRAFFAGHFAELEAELGRLTPGGYSGTSPDRADAMVWALWALLLKPQRPVPRIRPL